MKTAFDMAMESVERDIDVYRQLARETAERSMYRKLYPNVSLGIAPPKPWHPNDLGVRGVNLHGKVGMCADGRESCCGVDSPFVNIGPHVPSSLVMKYVDSCQ